VQMNARFLPYTGTPVVARSAHGASIRSNGVSICGATVLDWLSISAAHQQSRGKLHPLGWLGSGTFLRLAPRAMHVIRSAGNAANDFCPDEERDAPGSRKATRVQGQKQLKDRGKSRQLGKEKRPTKGRGNPKSGRVVNSSKPQAQAQITQHLQSAEEGVETPAAGPTLITARSGTPADGPPKPVLATSTISEAQSAPEKLREVVRLMSSGYAARNSSSTENANIEDINSVEEAGRALGGEGTSSKDSNGVAPGHNLLERGSRLINTTPKESRWRLARPPQKVSPDPVAQVEGSQPLSRVPQSPLAAIPGHINLSGGRLKPRFTRKFPQEESTEKQIEGASPRLSESSPSTSAIPARKRRFKDGSNLRRHPLSGLMTGYETADEVGTRRSSAPAAAVGPSPDWLVETCPVCHGTATVLCGTCYGIWPEGTCPECQGVVRRSCLE
jgi:hypothetical protein